MPRSSIRSIVAAAAVAAVLSYVAAGHALPQMNAHGEMAGAAAGLCLLLVTVVGRVALPRRDLAPAPAGPIARAAPCSEPALPLPDCRARASPRQLQRFRN
jgi:hypothetical protein